MEIRLLSKTERRTLGIAEATPMSVVPQGRADRPYPPGNVRVNGVAWPDGAAFAGDATLTWAHRHRLARAGRAIVRQDAPSTVSVPEGTYTVEALVGGATRRTATGLTGASFVYTAAQRAADDPDPSLGVRFRITPVSGSLSGTPRTTDEFFMA